MNKIYNDLKRDEWISCAKEIMGNLILNGDSGKKCPPLIFKRTDTKVSYPRKFDPLYRSKEASFECLSRSFFLAAILICNDPSVTINGIILKEYYKSWILAACSPGDELYLGNYKTLCLLKRKQERVKSILKKVSHKINRDEPIFQHTCECALLSIALEISDKYIWQEYSKEEQYIIADFLKSFGEAPTLSSNWEWFNVLILSFLYKRGYITEDVLIITHLTNIQGMYCGDGWFLDGGKLDYYNAWTFHFFGPLFNYFYGYSYWKKFAVTLEAQTNEFLVNYSRFFDGNGYMTMFGRSNIYRNAASAPFAAGMFMDNCGFYSGTARWILSSNLKQFIFDHHCFHNGIPSLGFYSEFLPCVQGYSSIASPLWMCFPFIVILLPEDHLFWNTKINRGIWDCNFENYLINNIADGRLTVVNYKASESVEISVNDLDLPVNHHLLNQYSRLAFSSKFCWNDFVSSKSPSMQFGLLYNRKVHIPSKITFNKFSGEVLYKDIIFADIGVDIAVREYHFRHGTVRVASLKNNASISGELFVGSYAVSSDNGLFCQKEFITNDYNAVILSDKEMSVAFISYFGLSKPQVIKSTGTNPNRKYSAYISAKAINNSTFAFGVFFKYAGEDWTNYDLKPFDTLDCDA